MTVYNRRPYYPATRGGSMDAEGDGVRAAARPSPTDSAIGLCDGWRALVFVKDGKLRVSLIPRIGVAAHLNLDPAAARRLGSAIVARADLAQLEAGA